MVISIRLKRYEAAASRKARINTPLKLSFEEYLDKYISAPVNKTRSPGISPNLSKKLAQPEDLLTMAMDICRSVNAKYPISTDPIRRR